MPYEFGQSNLDPSYTQKGQCCQNCARCVDKYDLICNHDDSKVPPDPSDYYFPATPEGEQALNDTWDAWADWTDPRYVTPYGICKKFKAK